MTVSSDELKKIAQLAYLDKDTNNPLQLEQEISSIMDFVEQLRAANTQGIAPLFHPFALHQPLRTDEVTEASCIAELNAIAPLMEDDLFWVPKVIETGKSS